MRKTTNNQPNNPIPLVLIAVGAVLVIGVLLWQLAQSRTAPITAAAEPGKPTLAVEQIERVTVEDAKKAFDEKKAIIVDVRSYDSYAAGHITGAISIPLGELEQGSGELKAGEWIILYCT